MYPRVSDLINDLFGTDMVLPAKTFGLFLALAFIAAFFVLNAELKRKEKAGHFRLRRERVRVQGPMHIREVILQGLLWGLVGYKLGYLFVDPELFNTDTQAALISLKGFWLTGLLGAGIAGGLRYRAYQQHKDLEERFEDVDAGPSFYVGTVVTIAFVAGILGAKLFAMIDPSSNFWRDPIGDLLSLNGLSFFGGLLAAGFLITRYLYLKGFGIVRAIDAFAPCLILAYAVGRIGCQLSGDGDWGIMNPDPQPDWLAWAPEWTWAFDYPHNVAFPRPNPQIDCIQGTCNTAVLIPGCTDEFCTRLQTPVFPTPFYETTIGLIIFSILMFLRKRLKYVGQLTGVYLFLIGMERFWIEKIRVNEVHTFLGIEFSQAEFIATMLMLSGIAIWIYAQRKQLPFVVQPPADSSA